MSSRVSVRPSALGMPARSSAIEPCATSWPFLMMATWLQRRSTISRTCDVRKMVTPRSVIRGEQFLQCAGGKSVHAFERLIEKKNARTVDDGGGQGKFFLHAMGVVSDHSFRPVGELHEFEKFVAAFVRSGLLSSPYMRPTNSQIFRRGQAFEQAHAFRNDANLALHLDGMLAKNRCPSSAMRPEVGASRPVSILMVVDLPAPFGPEIQRTARFNLEIDIVDGSSSPKRRVRFSVEIAISGISGSSGVIE